MTDTSSLISAIYSACCTMSRSNYPITDTAIETHMISQAVIPEIIHYKPVHIYFSEVIFRDISSQKKQCSEISLQFVCLHLQQVRYCFMMYYSNQVGVAYTFFKCSIFIYMFLKFMQKLKIMFFGLYIFGILDSRYIQIRQICRALSFMSCLTSFSFLCIL